MINRDSSIPPLRILTVSALPTAPIKVRQVVPSKRLTISVKIPVAGKPSMRAKIGEASASKKPVANQ